MSPAPSNPSAVPPVVSGASELNGLWERPPWPAGGEAASMSTYHTTGPTTSMETVAVSFWSADR